MTVAAVDFEQAVELARTGDIWLFRGESTADRAIRVVTNAPVNHVGMAVVLDDLPPMMWHAELGQALPDQWTGDHHRGVQLHLLTDAVLRWVAHYRQEAWMRQLTPDVGRLQEDALLRTIARWNGTSFPTTASLALRWTRGRLGRLRARPAGRHGRPAAAYCAEVVAVTYEAMGLLSPDRSPNWYDPGRFWSGDSLELAPGWSLGGEIPVRVDRVRTTPATP